VDIDFRAPTDRAASLTWGQQRVAQLIADLHPDHATLNLRFACGIKPGMAIGDIASALRDMVEACESVRTLFNPDAPAGQQQRVVAEGRVVVGVRTVQAATFAEAEEWAAELAAAEFAADELPIRMSLVVDQAGPNFLLFAISHLASDFLGARWLLWPLRHILRPLRNPLPDEEPAATQPVDVSLWENSDAGRKEGGRALDRHARSLARMPQSMLPRPPIQPLHPRYQYVELQTSAGAWCLSHLAQQHGVSESAVGHAVLCLILAHVSGLRRAHLQVCVGNRVDRRFATVVGSLTQDVPTCVTVDDSDFDTLLRRSAGAVGQATMTGRFPHHGLAEARRRVETDRGFPLDLSFWLNSRLFVPVSVEAPTEAQLRDELPRTSVRWLGGDERSTSTLFCYLDRVRDVLTVRTLVDTAYLSRDEAEQWLRAFESILVNAVLRPERGARELVADTGLASFQPTADWVQLDHSWIHLPTTAQHLREALPGVPLRVCIDPDGEQPGLVAILTDPGTEDNVAIPAGDAVERLRGCKVALWPRRFAREAEKVNQ
jgi:hypothetical protein